MLNITHYSVQFSSFQSLSCIWLFATPWTGAHQAALSIANSRSLLTHVHWVGDAIQPSHPLSTPPPAFNLSQHQGLSNESVLHIRWWKYWSFSFSISASYEYSGPIPLGWTGWISLLSKKTLKSLQHHSSKASKCGPLEKRMANPFSILALRTPWTVLKGKKIGHWKMNSPGW